MSSFILVAEAQYRDTPRPPMLWSYFSLLRLPGLNNRPGFSKQRCHVWRNYSNVAAGVAVVASPWNVLFFIVSASILTQKTLTDWCRSLDTFENISAVEEYMISLIIFNKWKNIYLNCFSKSMLFFVCCRKKYGPSSYTCSDLLIRSRMKKGISFAERRLNK